MHASNHLKSDRGLAMAIAIILMIATYMAASIRSMLDLTYPGDLLSLKRLIATAAGAGFFWLAIYQASHPSAAGVFARMVRLIAVSIFGAAALLAFRIGYDLVWDSHNGAIVSHNVRWMLSWFGYFAAAIAGYFAIMFLDDALDRRSLLQDSNVGDSGLAENATSVPHADIVPTGPDYEEADPLAGLIGKS